MSIAREWLLAGGLDAYVGGHAGYSQIGLIVPLQRSIELPVVLDALLSARVQATLLIPSAWAHTVPESMRTITTAGHQLGGWGAPEQVPLLEVLAGRGLEVWGLSAPDCTLRTLRALQRWNLRPLLLEQRRRPGGWVVAAPRELCHVLGELKRDEYQPVPLNALPELKAATPQDWVRHHYLRLIEQPFERHLIVPTQRADAVLRVAALDHAPSPLPFPPQTPTAELHLHSERLVGLASRSPHRAYRAFLRSFRDIAQVMSAPMSTPALQPAQVIFAVSLFTPPLAQMGFTLIKLPPWRARWYGLGFRLLRLVHGTARTPSNTEPFMAWITREDFLERFGSKG